MVKRRIAKSKVMENNTAKGRSCSSTKCRGWGLFVISEAATFLFLVYVQYVMQLNVNYWLSALIMLVLLNIIMFCHCRCGSNCNCK